MSTRGIRVVRPFRHWPGLVEAALIGFAAGLCWTGISFLLLPLAIGFLGIPVYWVRRDQDRILFPLRTGILFSFAYVGPILASAITMFTGATLSMIGSVVLFSAILFGVGLAWGAVVRLLFQAVAYQVVLGSEGCCDACGYDLTGATSEVCSECGTKVRLNSPVSVEYQAPTLGKKIRRVIPVTTMIALLIMWIASWEFPMSHAFMTDKMVWGTRLSNGAIQLSGYSNEHGGHSFVFEGKEAAIQPLYFRTQAGGITLISANVPLWIPLAFFAYATYWLVPRKTKPGKRC